MTLNLDLGHMPPPPARKYRIGAIGTGFIMRDIHLVSYARAGYEVVAIASDQPDQARQIAQDKGIKSAYETWQELIQDKSIEVVDIAVPPHVQPEIIFETLRSAPHIRGILAQKPLAMSYADARAMVEACEKAGVKLSVNQNMRYDQAMRALKTLLMRGDLGEPVLGTIEMRAIPHWQAWLKDYDRLTLFAMSIHHLDCFRFLFGNPDSIYCSARTDPRTKFPHRDGIALYILEYANGLRASAWDDVWAGPAREGAAADLYIKWRVEGTEGVAQGTIGWPSYPNVEPSTLRFASTKQPDCWLAPQWKEVWFPDAFSGTMGELMDSMATGRESLLSGRDNLGTVALVEAAYKSLDEHRPVRIEEIIAADAHAAKV